MTAHLLVVTPAKAGAHNHRACSSDTPLLQSLGYTDNEIAPMLDERQFFVCTLASRKHGTLYIGVTNDLVRRVHEHREGLLPGFTRKYGVKHLVYYEAYQDIGDAISREKALKEWRRDWKIGLIEQSNPEWTDPYPGLAA
jgi:putative endonuclease